MKRVMCFGTFDLLHPGHVRFLQFAKKQGTELVVVVARDANRQRLTGETPWYTLRERLEVIAALRMVDHAVPGATHDFLAMIKKWRPQIIVLGHDQRGGVGELRQWLLAQKTPIKVIRAPAWQRQRFASRLLKKCQTSYNKPRYD